MISPKVLVFLLLMHEKVLDSISWVLLFCFNCYFSIQIRVRSTSLSAGHTAAMWEHILHIFVAVEENWVSLLIILPLQTKLTQVFPLGNEIFPQSVVTFTKEKNRSFKFSVREIRELMISHVVKDRYHIWKFGKLIGHSLESFFREVSFCYH